MGSPKPITELDENEAAAIAELKLMENSKAGESWKAVGFTVKFKFTDRLTAFALLGKPATGMRIGKKSPRLTMDGIKDYRREFRRAFHIPLKRPIGVCRGAMKCIQLGLTHKIFNFPQMLRRV